MTIQNRYTVRMNILFFNVLLASTYLGILWLVLLFCGCFLFVHLARLVHFGRQYQKQASRTPEKNDKSEKPNKIDAQEKNTEKKSPPSQSSGEPIYYIVERKRRMKSNYGEPKQIKFK